MIRVSGPNAFKAAAVLVEPVPLPEPRRAALRTFRRGGGAVIDRGLLILFPGPASATGEDLAELHVHGSRAVVAAVEAELAGIDGLEPAAPGAFTRRMLANGRIDLAEAEALGDLLAAETEAQRRAAIENANGALSRQVAAWTRTILALAAQAEAAIDFDDEDDVAASAQSDVRSGASRLAAAIGAVLDNPPAERLRDGIRVVLAGPPNTGKSTLLNALAGREAAIVSPIAGTTRDLIEAPVIHDGIAYLLIDAAGLTEHPSDAIERIGIERAREALATADIVLWLGDEAPPRIAAPVVAVHARCDLPGRDAVPAGRLAVSANNGRGLAPLWSALAAQAAHLLPSLDRLVLNRRQLRAGGEAAEALRLAAHMTDPLLVAEHLRQARVALDAITGRASTEAMLDDLFGRFCIGK